MKSQVVKRSVVIDGHKTSISLEDAFWNNLKAIARPRPEVTSTGNTKAE
jgi:predicted DNA-binding ribbon-helix-helix protein